MRDVRGFLATLANEAVANGILFVILLLRRILVASIAREVIKVRVLIMFYCFEVVLFNLWNLCGIFTHTYFLLLVLQLELENLVLVSR